MEIKIHIWSLFVTKDGNQVEMKIGKTGDLRGVVLTHEMADQLHAWLGDYLSGYDPDDVSVDRKRSVVSAGQWSNDDEERFNAWRTSIVDYMAVHHPREGLPKEDRFEVTRQHWRSIGKPDKYEKGQK